MRVIFKRTLQETLKLSFLILMLAAGILGGVVISRMYSYRTAPAFDYFLNNCLIIQHLAVFFLICGAVLMVIVSAVGSGLIAGEVHEGTFRILVAKPNSRMSILLGKVLGMLFGSILLMVMGISALYLSEFLFGSYDGPIVTAMLSYFPAYLLYGGIVTLFFSALAVFLSCITKKKVIALLPMLLIMILVLVLPMILRIIMMLGGKQSNWMPFADLNYHFGSIYKWCLDLFGGIHGTSEQLELPTILLNIYKQTNVDRDLSRTFEYGVITTNNMAVPVNILLCVYGGLAVILYILSFAIIRRKDV